MKFNVKWELYNLGEFKKVFYTIEEALKLQKDLIEAANLLTHKYTKGIFSKSPVIEVEE